MPALPKSPRRKEVSPSLNSGWGGFPWWPETAEIRGAPTLWCRGHTEHVSIGIEKAQSAGTVVVTGSQPLQVIREAAGEAFRFLGLKSFCELADVVQGDEKGDQANRLFPGLG